MIAQFNVPPIDSQIILEKNREREKKKDTSAYLPIVYTRRNTSLYLVPSTEYFYVVHGLNR